MEDSCPATPLILTGRDSKSPLQVALSSPESEGMKSRSRDSPDSRCVICLGRLQNKSFTDSCLHQFCFQCLLQWSKVKAECPLCKQPFKSIIHNVRSNLDYDQYHVEHGEPRYVLSDIMHSYNFDLIPVDRRFRYRSTMTRDYFRELAESFLAHTRRLPEDSYQINPLVPVDPAPAANVRRSNNLHASSQPRTRQRSTSDFRRNVYAQDLWVQDLANISGRYRDCPPHFDQNTLYGANPNYATEVQEISSSSCDDDSDIEILETVKTEEKKYTKSSRQGLRKVLLKRAAEPKLEEPVAGPSGITSAKAPDPIDICESDPEEVKVLDYVKPEPEVVTLSSGDDMPVYSDLDMSNGEYAEVMRSEPSKSRQSSSCENDKKKSRSRSGKGKCRSNGFGLKGKQKRKYIKSRRHRSSSSSSSNSFISGISSRSSTSRSSNRSSSSTSTSSSSASSLLEKRRSRSGSSPCSKSSHKSSSKSKRKKSKVYRKKLKKKVNHKTSKRHKSCSETDKRKKKKVRSCVIVPSWPCDSPPSSHRRLSRSNEAEPKSLKSYWSMALDDRSNKWQELEERNTKRKYRDSSVERKSKKRSRGSSCSSAQSVPSGSDAGVDENILSLACGDVTTNLAVKHNSQGQFVNSD